MIYSITMAVCVTAPWLLVIYLVSLFARMYVTMGKAIEEYEKAMSRHVDLIEKLVTEALRYEEDDAEADYRNN